LLIFLTFLPFPPPASAAFPAAPAARRTSRAFVSKMHKQTLPRLRFRDQKSLFLFPAELAALPPIPVLSKRADDSSSQPQAENRDDSPRPPSHARNLPIQLPACVHPDSVRAIVPPRSFPQVAGEFHFPPYFHVHNE